MKKNQKTALAAGAGLAAIAAAATGIYMMTGKNAKNRKKAAKWVGDMQKDVVKQLNVAGKATKATYHKVVDTAAANYKNLKNVDTADLAAAAAELKASWDAISSEMKTATATVRKVVPKTAKSVAKKVTSTAKKAAKTVSAAKQKATSTKKKVAKKSRK